MTGLFRGTVSLFPHDNAWEREAASCVALLGEILGSDMVDAQHVGSTAIVSICAKPILDIAVAVRDLSDITKHNEALSARGIHYRKQEFDTQLLYVCGDLARDTLTHHIHVMLADSNEWHNYLNFRDYMNCHAQEAKAYAALKEELAAQYANDRSSYTAGKHDFIVQILQKAAIWRKSIPSDI